MYLPCRGLPASHLSHFLFLFLSDSFSSSPEGSLFLHTQKVCVFQALLFESTDIEKSGAEYDDMGRERNRGGESRWRAAGQILFIRQEPRPKRLARVSARQGG